VPTERIINAPVAAVIVKLKYERLPIIGISMLAKVWAFVAAFL
jgi:hypothetical protein